MTTQHYPLWEELPEIELYLDQVLLYVNQVTQSTLGPNDKGLTASMVNNYVKHGHVAKPIKKKIQCCSSSQTYCDYESKDRF